MENSQLQRNIESKVEEESFSGTILFIPKKRKGKGKVKDFRVQVSIEQRIISDGFMESPRPTISFSVILPANSEVFVKVASGDLAGLRRMLIEGKASLSDCNEKGNSLLTVSSTDLEPEHVLTCK
jgi:hypothetical protein